MINSNHTLMQNAIELSSIGMGLVFIFLIFLVLMIFVASRILGKNDFINELDNNSRSTSVTEEEFFVIQAAIKAHLRS